MNRHWETRYSSAEMMYLKVERDGVTAWLNDHKDSGEWWTLEGVLEGRADGTIRGVFGSETLEEVKASVRAEIDARRDR